MRYGSGGEDIVQKTNAVQPVHVEKRNKQFNVDMEMRIMASTEPLFILHRNIIL